MWFGHELGWWGFWMSITAFLLAFPISLLANLCTPLVKNWWAARSQRALTKRIEQLQKELKIAEKTPVWTPFEFRVLHTVSGIGLLVVFNTLGVVVLFLIVIYRLYSGSHVMSVVSIVVGCAILAFDRFVYQIIEKNRNVGRRRWREETAKSIEELSKKIHKE